MTGKSREIMRRSLVLMPKLPSPIFCCLDVCESHTTLGIKLVPVEGTPGPKVVYIYFRLDHGDSFAFELIDCVERLFKPLVIGRRKDMAINAS